MTADGATDPSRPRALVLELDGGSAAADRGVVAIRAPRPCVSFGAGHTVHLSQWNKAVGDSETKIAGRILEIDDHQIVVDVVAGYQKMFYNHDLDRARDLLDKIGADVDVQTRWSLLWFGTYLVSIQAAGRGPLALCPVDGPSQRGFFLRP